MTSDHLVTERFGQLSLQAKIENLFGLLLVKPVLWASGAAAGFQREWAPASQDRLSPHPPVRSLGNTLARLLFPTSRSTALSQTSIRGIPVQQLSPTRPTGAVVLYFHGGGFVVGGPPTHRMLTSTLARESGANVLVPDYRMPPEIPFTEVVDDCLAIYRQLLDDGVQPGRIVFAGDSAGGYLAIATAQTARDAGLPVPAGLALLAPWLDLRKTLGSAKPPATEYLVSIRWAKSIVAQFVAPHGPEALSNPVARGLAGLPPVLVQASSAEVLYPDAISLAEALAEAGVPTRLQTWDGAMHVFQLAGNLVPESRQAIANIAEFVRIQTSSTLS